MPLDIDLIYICQYNPKQGIKVGTQWPSAHINQALIFTFDMYTAFFVLTGCC